MFYNYTNEDFECTWGGIPYLFEAGKVYDGVAIAKDKSHSVQLTEVVCRVFAHHLATKVFDTPSITQNFKKNSKDETVPTFSEQFAKLNLPNMELMIRRALTPPSTEVKLPDFTAELPLMRDTVAPAIAEYPVEAPKKKPGRPAKIKEEASPSPEAEFVGV